jgi:hypothetical protein
MLMKKLPDWVAKLPAVTDWYNLKDIENGDEIELFVWNTAK